MTHRLIAYGRRNGKNLRAQQWVEKLAKDGEHVHENMEKCYNGSELCDAFVRERFQWDGRKLVALGGENVRK